WSREMQPTVKNHSPSQATTVSSSSPSSSSSSSSGLTTAGGNRVQVGSGTSSSGSVLVGWLVGDGLGPRVVLLVPPPPPTLVPPPPPSLVSGPFSPYHGSHTLFHSEGGP